MGNRKPTPTWAKVIQQAIDAKLLDVHTAIPGIILEYDYDKNLATVKPMIKRQYILNNEEVSLPNIVNVPVGHLRLGKAHVRLPVKPGDEGLILFTERSLDRWLETGEERVPDDIRKFSLSDAVFRLGLTSKPNQMNSDSDQDAIEIKNGSMVVEVLPSGKIKIRNKTGELLAALSLAFAALSAEPFLVAKSVYSSTKSIVDSMKG